MNRIVNFYDLETWKNGHEIVLKIYVLTKDYPKDEIFGIISQLRRCSSSVTANIAEGFERYHFKDKARFYYQARGSVAETQNFLILSKDLGFINEFCFNELMTQTDLVRRMINGMIKSIENQE